MARPSQGQRPAEPARGLLHDSDREPPRQRVRVLPPAALEPYVHHFWLARWGALPTPRVVEALPYPCVSIVFEALDGALRAEVLGPRTGRVTRVLSGAGQVFGLTFRPAAFAPLYDGDLARLADRSLALGELFGPEGDAWAAATHAEPDLDARIALATAFLLRRLAPLPVEARRLRDLVERIAADPSLVRVEQVCLASGIDLRALQRGFRRFVGVTPKWVLGRFRLIEAVERLKAPEPPSLVELAASLDYADQAHFARDFKRVVGETPRRFVERLRRDARTR
ncbi:MAG: AraC family transcriptional regulator [Myxococcota bacterium]